MKIKNKLLVWVIFSTVAGCKKPPTAIDVCHKFEAAGVAANCKVELPAGMWSDASEACMFDLVRVAGKGGGVYIYETDAKYESLLKSWDTPMMKAMGGPHRYGNAKRRIYTQFNQGAPIEDGAKAKAIIEDL